MDSVLQYSFGRILVMSGDRDMAVQNGQGYLEPNPSGIGVGRRTLRRSVLRHLLRSIWPEGNSSESLPARLLPEIRQENIILEFQ